jgi:hypothetical protein
MFCATFFTGHMEPISCQAPHHRGGDGPCDDALNTVRVRGEWCAILVEGGYMWQGGSVKYIEMVCRRQEAVYHLQGDGMNSPQEP